MRALRPEQEEASGLSRPRGGCLLPLLSSLQQSRSRGEGRDVRLPVPSSCHLQHANSDSKVSAWYVTRLAGVRQRGVCSSHGNHQSDHTCRGPNVSRGRWRPPCPGHAQPGKPGKAVQPCLSQRQGPAAGRSTTGTYLGAQAGHVCPQLLQLSSHTARRDSGRRPPLRAAASLILEPSYPTGVAGGT